MQNLLVGCRRKSKIKDGRRNYKEVVKIKTILQEKCKRNYSREAQKETGCILKS